MLYQLLNHDLDEFVDDLHWRIGIERGIAGIAAPSQDAAGIRILLVEDNQINQQVATELFESAGATVTVASHGGEAVSLLLEGPALPPFDIVFMDLQMPEMDGFTATRLVRARPELRKLPIIAMTAHALVEERQRCMDAGMNDHVSKPIEPEVLFATLLRSTKPQEGEAAGKQAPGREPAEEIILPQIEGLDVAGASSVWPGTNDSTEICSCSSQRNKGTCTLKS